MNNISEKNTATNVLWKWISCVIIFLIVIELNNNSWLTKKKGSIPGI
jgi:hypothetical protein